MECLRCHTDKPLTPQFFHRQKGSSTGFRLTCKECRKTDSAQYHKEHAAEIIKKTDIWRKENPEKARAIGLKSAKKFYWKQKTLPETPEKIEKALKTKKQRKQYRENNKETIAEKKSDYQKVHREQNNAAKKRWDMNHPEEAKIKKRHDAKVRKAKKRGASCNDLTQAQWEEIQASYRFRCVYCGKKVKNLTQDHLTPLSKGGSHTASNIVPACRSCNGKKHTGPVLVPVQPLLLTEAPSKRPYRKYTGPVPAPLQPLLLTLAAPKLAPVPGT